MFTGKTRSGFEFSLQDEVLDDYELLETLQDIDDGDYGKTHKDGNDAPGTGTERCIKGSCTQWKWAGISPEDARRSNGDF